MVIGNFPEGLHDADDLLYVTRTDFNPDDYSYGQGDVAVIDPNSMTLLSTYNVGVNPQWISADTSGRLHELSKQRMGM